MKLIINKNSCLRFCPFAVSRGMKNMSKNALSIGLQHCHQTVRKNPSVRFDGTKVETNNKGMKLLRLTWVDGIKKVQGELCPCT